MEQDFCFWYDIRIYSEGFLKAKQKPCKPSGWREGETDHGVW